MCFSCKKKIRYKVQLYIFWETRKIKWVQTFILKLIEKKKQQNETQKEKNSIDLMRLNWLYMLIYRCYERKNRAEHISLYHTLELQTSNNK